MQRNCPSQAELVAFHLGTLAVHQVDAIADHLETCSACEAVLERLDTSVDPLVAVLRKPLPLSVTHYSEDDRSGRVQGGNASRARSGGDADGNLSAPENWPTLPGYQILGPLGRGGVGLVYKARQLALDRMVALKRLRSISAHQMARSRTEAEALAHLQHPNIVQIHEVIHHEGSTYLALELVEGCHLGHDLGKPQPQRQTAALLETVARAVHYAHSHGIIHRDLKPANILIASGTSAAAPRKPPVTSGVDSPNPGLAGAPAAIAKIVDFGLAKRLQAESGETQDGDVIGTPAYMAPEQALGKNDTVGPATDVYSLGVILYEMLTGRVPLQGPTTLDTLVLVRTEEPVPPRRLQPRIDRDLETICLKCLEKEPARRYASAAELADDLRRFQDGTPIKARPTPAWERAWKWARRKPLVAGLSAAVLFLAVAGFGLVAWQWRRAETKAESEALAKKAAQDNEQKEKEARRQGQWLSANMALDHGAALCEAGDLERGLLWLVRALELATLSGDAGLEHCARSNLAGWQAQIVRPRAALNHDSWCWQVAFSPDGQSALTACYDGSARMWDTARGQQRGPDLKHDQPVWAVAFSPDGKLVLTGSGNPESPQGNACLWDAAGMQRLFSPLPHPALVHTVAFHPGGQTFLTVCDEQACVWKIAEGSPVGPPVKHPRGTTGRRLPKRLVAVLSPDGKLLASGGTDGTIRFWDATTLQPLGAPLEATGHVLTLCFSPDSKLLLSGCHDGGAQMWDVATRKPHGPVLQHAGRVKTAAFSPDGMSLATGGVVEGTDVDTGAHYIEGGEVRLWRSETGHALGQPLHHPAPVWSIAFSPGGRLLLTGGEDGQARFFLVASGAPLGRPLGHAGLVRNVTISPDGKLALTASAGGGANQKAWLWTLPAESALAQPLMQRGKVVDLAFGPDGQVLLTTADDGVVRLWNLPGGRAVHVPAPPEEPVHVASLSPDGKTIMTAARVGPMKSVARLWDSNRAQRHEFLFGDEITRIGFSRDGRMGFLGGLHGKIYFWELETGKIQEAPLDSGWPLWSCAFSPDGERVLTAGAFSARLWDWRSRQALQEWKGSTFLVRAVFYPDGKRVLLLANGLAQVGDIASGRVLGPPAFHPDGGIDVAVFSQDGKSVITVNRNRVARLWDVATGKSLGPPSGSQGIRSAAFTGDGKRIALGGADGRIALCHVPAPLDGSAARVRLNIEVLTGMQLDATEVLRQLTAEEIEQRRQQLNAQTK